MAQMPRNTGRIGLVLELEFPRQVSDDWVRLLVSLPGRDGTLSYVWTWEGVLPTAGVASDIETTILHQVTTAILAQRGGIQGQLPGLQRRSTDVVQERL